MKEKRIKRTPRHKRDPLELQIELALDPGSFIPDHGSFSFVGGLDEVAEQIGLLQKTDPARAAGLYETFVAGCKEKADELDDSMGSFGQFAGELICRWIKARQSSGASPDETAATLLGWMENDPYAFCFGIEKDLAKAFDKAGLAAFERLIRARFKAPRSKEWHHRQWANVLRAIYLAQRNTAAYEALTQQTGLEPRDCLALATVFISRKPDLALSWVERGLELEGKTPHGSAAGYELSRLQRELLTTLGRGDEALDAAWAEYRESPCKFSFDDLMKLVPKAARPAWREKALDAAKGADLHSAIGLLVETKEIDRLAELVRGTSDEALADISHYTTEPAAKKLEKPHPDLAARLWRAQAMRIVDAKKSKYYDAAVANLGRARKCYLRAGLVTEWEDLVRQIRADHHRKLSFMTAFESVAGGGTQQARPSFLDRAKDRWGVGRGDK